MYHSIAVLGVLAKDPKITIAQNGQPVTDLALRTSDRRQRDVWFHAKAVGKLAEYCEKNLKKGDYIFVEGQLMASAKGSPKVYLGNDGEYRADFKISIRILKVIDNDNNQTEGEQECQNAR